MSVLGVLEIVAFIALGVRGFVVWTRFCNRTNKSNAAWVFDRVWSYRSNLPARPRISRAN